MTRLARIWCPSCAKVAATIDRLASDTRLHETSRLVAEQGSLVITRRDRQAWPPEGKPTRRPIVTLIPLPEPLTAGEIVLDCPRCQQPMLLDLAVTAGCIRGGEDVRPTALDRSPESPPPTG